MIMWSVRGKKTRLIFYIISEHVISTRQHKNWVWYDHVIGPRQENAVHFYIISEHVIICRESRWIYERHDK